MSKYKKIRGLLASIVASATIMYYQYAPVCASTIRSYSQFRNKISTGEDWAFSDTLKSLINLGKNVGIVMMLGAFTVNVFSMIVQANKLGGTNVMGPEFNAAKKQEAYNGLGHACLAFAIIGASVEIFSWLMGFLIGG